MDIIHYMLTILGWLFMGWVGAGFFKGDALAFDNHWNAKLDATNLSRPPAFASSFPVKFFMVTSIALGPIGLLTGLLASAISPYGKFNWSPVGSK